MSQTRSLPGIHHTLPPFEDQVHVPPDGTVHNKHINILTHMADPSEAYYRPASQRGCNLPVQCLQSPGNSEHQRWYARMQLTKMLSSFQEHSHALLLFSNSLQTDVFTGLSTSRAVRVRLHCCPSMDES